MTLHDATEHAYKNGFKAGKESVLKELLEVYNDLNKISEAADNTFNNDVSGLLQSVRTILVKNGIQLP